MDWNTILQAATLFSVIVGVAGIGMWAGSVNTRLAHLSQRIEAFDTRLNGLDTRLHSLTEKVQRVEVALANLRAELFEKFQPKTHA
jgi:hypothetical protein